MYKSRNTKDKDSQVRPIRRYKSDRRDIRKIFWPGTDKEVGLLYLSCEENEKAYFAARDWFDRQGQKIDQFSAMQFDQEMSYQLCALMLVEPDSVKPEYIFSEAREARKELSPNEAEWFVNKHIEFQTEELNKWGQNELDPYLMQIAAELDLEEDTEPQKIVEAVKDLLKSS